MGHPARDRELLKILFILDRKFQLPALAAAEVAGSGIFETKVHSQCNPVYKAFYRIRCCGNETNCE